MYFFSGRKTKKQKRSQIQNAAYFESWGFTDENIDPYGREPPMNMATSLNAQCQFKTKENETDAPLMRFPAAGKYHAQVTEVTLSNHAN